MDIGMRLSCLWTVRRHDFHEKAVKWTLKFTSSYLHGWGLDVLAGWSSHQTGGGSPRFPWGDGRGEVPGGDLEAKSKGGQAGSAWRGLGRHLILLAVLSPG